MKKALSLLIISVIFTTLCSCKGKDKVTDNRFYPTVTRTGLSDSPMRVTDGIYVTHIAGFSGAFAEDGKDMPVENVVQIAVENRSGKDIQLLEISASDNLGRELKFSITTLPAGAVTACCEKNKAEFSDGLFFKSAEAERIAYFQAPMSLYPEKLQIMCYDNKVEIKNISDTNYPGGRLCYKTVERGIFAAGITYSASIPAIPAGKSEILTTNHYNENKSRIMFITNAE